MMSIFLTDSLFWFYIFNYSFLLIRMNLRAFINFAIITRINLKVIQTNI
jgi:hypothetical protein